MPFGGHVAKLGTNIEVTDIREQSLLTVGEIFEPEVSSIYFQRIRKIYRKVKPSLNKVIKGSVKFSGFEELRKVFGKRSE